MMLGFSRAMRSRSRSRSRSNRARGWWIAALNKLGKCPSGSSATEFCLVATDHAAGTSSTPCNATCPRCASHGIRIRDFFYAKSDAEVFAEFSNKWVVSRARALL